MDKIKVAVLNPTAISEAEKMMVCAARLTQRGHTVKDLSDFLALYDKEYTEKTAKVMTQLPHPTIQKFAVINAVIVGASRRFLAQITRHQNEVKFMSASLQYSDYSNEADFVVPYELLDSQMRFSYLSQCQDAMRKYKLLVEYGVDNDSAGYLAPQRSDYQCNALSVEAHDKPENLPAQYSRDPLRYASPLGRALRAGSGALLS